MKKPFFLCLVLILIIPSLSLAQNKKVTFSGKQVKGTGPLNNAKVSSDTLVVKKEAKIIKITGNGKYCIWLVGKWPAYLCSKKTSDLVGKVLPEGEYTILPSVGKYQSYATTSITVECPNCEIKKKR